MDEFYNAFLRTAESAGLDVISKWTAAKILYIAYRWGGNSEMFTYSPKFRADIDHIRRKYGIQGTCVPDAELVGYIKQLDAETIAHCERYKDYVDSEKIPEWANDLCQERYGFKLGKTISETDKTKE